MWVLAGSYFTALSKMIILLLLGAYRTSAESAPFATPPERVRHSQATASSIHVAAAAVS